MNLIRPKAVFILVALLLLFVGDKGDCSPLSQEWPEGWSGISRLFPTGILGDRFLLAVDNHGISMITVDGTFQEDLILQYRLLEEDQVLASTELARGNVGYPVVLLGEEGVRHVLWREREGRIHRLVYVVISPFGEVLRQRVLMEKDYLIQDLTALFIGEELHLVWVDSKDVFFTIRHGVVTETGLSKVQPVAVTEGTSMRPSILVDGMQALHVVWIEGGLRNRLLHSVRHMDRFQAPRELAELTEGMVLHNGRVYTVLYPETIGVLWDDSATGNLPLGTYLYQVLLRWDGQLLEGPRAITTGSRLRVYPHENQYAAVFQRTVSGSPQVFYGNLSEEGMEDITRLNSFRIGSFRPEFVITQEGVTRVFWLQASGGREYYIHSIDTKNPMTPPFWWYMGLDQEGPLSHLAFLLAGSVMLSFVYIGMNLLILLLAFALLSFVMRIRAFAMGPVYTLLLGAAFLMLLQQSPLAFGQPTYFGGFHYFLSVLFATLFSGVVVRGMSVDKSFEYAIVLGLWLFSQQFFALIPGAMIAL